VRTFFVLGVGRSGTAHLASLLGTDRRGIVHHEPYPCDRHLPVLRHAGTFGRAVDTLLEERFEKLLGRAADAEFYGEVNSYLRYEAEWLRQRFSPVLIHLVRDGRAFVRSAWIRPVYTAHASAPILVPRDDDPYADRWRTMSRFERLCWYWTHMNRHLKDRIDRTVRLEDLVADYDVFDRAIAHPTGLRITRHAWHAATASPRNTSGRYRVRQWARRLLPGRSAHPITPLPHWSDWSRDQTRAFKDIAGDLMGELGYL
jgi:hypothetical protein